MELEKRREVGGSKLSRSKTVTVRLDPRLRYLADLAARKQRRTLSSFVEWAIEESLQHVALQEKDDGTTVSVSDLAEVLWDVDEPDRFVALAARFPEMLTHDEQLLWKTLLKFDAEIIQVRKEAQDIKNKWLIELEENVQKSALLHDHWDDIKAVAKGEADPSILQLGTDEANDSD